MTRRALAVVLAGLGGLSLCAARPGSSEASATREDAPPSQSLAHAASRVAAPEPPAPPLDTAVTAPAQASGAQAACPADMLLVEGSYCTEVRHVCKKWLDDEKLSYARCAVYEPRATCVGSRRAMRFCVDRHEYTAPGDELPKNYGSFVTATKICKNLAKRVCTESEWNFACEGEEMRPYPYGWSREPKCNQDQAELYDRSRKKLALKDLRAPASAHPECVSPFGVHDMVGNMDEPVLREAARYDYPFRNALKGGWWMSGRNRCRPSTTAHDDHYQDVQVGVRCCADTPGD
ncbi:MAG TPA: SUMF1/EgtB/PvdO family nonheme iron enzyme [Polyangiaceae bacterium]|nr:SUMF1/EgtB/PvdO family nonheme iron enzyme [Polyangiaceae bacterium]